MPDKIETLSKELSALSDDDLSEIAGSGDENFVNISNRQCEKIQDWYEQNAPFVESEYRALTNYGGPCPRYMFEQAVRIDNSD